MERQRENLQAERHIEHQGGRYPSTPRATKDSEAKLVATDFAGNPLFPRRPETIIAPTNPVPHGRGICSHLFTTPT